MKLLKIALALLGLAVVAGMLLAGYKYQTSEFASDHATILDDLRELKRLDANVDTLSLKSRFGMDNNYDKLAQMANEQSLAVNRLKSRIEAFDLDAENELNVAFTEYQQRIINKLDQIENFKAHNAVLRNSVNYAPIAGEELTSIAENAGLTDTAALLRETTTEILKYALATGPVSSDHLKLLATQLQGLDSQMPEQARILSLEFTNHLRTLLEEKEITDVYLMRTIESSTPAGLVRLESALSNRYVQLSTDSRQANVMLLGFFALLLAGVLVLAFKLRNLYGNLETAVSKRTEEIEHAHRNLQESQEQLIQSEKMASLGQMVAGVAHEINTPLSYISSNVDTVRLNVGKLGRVLVGLESMSNLLGQPRPDGGQVKKQLFQVVRAYRNLNPDHALNEMRALLKDSSYGLREISELVTSLKDFSRVDRAEAELYDLHEGIEKTLKICSSELRTRIMIRRHYGDLPEVECAPAQINQVLMNIIMNAAQAIDGHGEIEITTVHGDGMAQIIITDSGHGMSEDVQHKVFDPFFTTKDIGEGTGLGLSICYKLIKSHGGSIEVESKPGRGTTFTISIPVRQGEARLLNMVTQA